MTISISIILSLIQSHLGTIKHICPSVRNGNTGINGYNCWKTKMNACAPPVAILMILLWISGHMSWKSIGHGCVIMHQCHIVIVMRQCHIVIVMRQCHIVIVMRQCHIVIVMRQCHDIILSRYASVSHCSSHG
jgi:hypothetical protein